MAEPKIVLSAVDQTRAAIDSAKRNLQGLGHQVDMTRVAFAGLGGLALTAMFVGAVHSSADYQDSLGKLAQRSGVAVEALSGLAYAAELADVSRDDLTKGLKKLSIEIDGGGAKLKSLGITATTADGAFLQLADRFQNMPDGVEKTALAAQLLGEKFGPNLITLLNQGAAGIKAATDEAERFGLIVSKEAAVAAEEFNDNLTRLERSVQGAKVALTGDLVKGIGLATKAFLEASAEGGRLAGIIAGIQMLLTGDDRHKNNVQMVELTDKLLQAENALAAARASGMNAGGIAARQKWLDQIKEQLRTTQSYRKVLDELEKPAKKVAPDPQTPVGGASRAIKEDKEYLWHRAQWLKSYDEQVRQREEIDKREAATADSHAKIIGDAYDQEIRDIEAFRKKQDGRPGLLDQDLFRLGGGEEESRKRALAARLEERLNAGEAFSPEQLDRIVRGIGGVNAEMEKGRDIAGDFAAVFESGFEKAILSGEKLSDVIKALGMDILQIGIRTAITQPLGKAAGDWFAGMFAGVFGGPKAQGGPVSAGVPYLVGEEGPELFMPSAAGQIVPNSKMGGGTTIININASVGDIASKSDVVAGMQAVSGQIVGRLARSRGYGGAFS